MRRSAERPRSIDDNVGRLLDYLESSGLAKNTLVMYTSDQGFFLGEHGWFDKRFIYEESFQMPVSPLSFRPIAHSADWAAPGQRAWYQTRLSLQGHCLKRRLCTDVARVRPPGHTFVHAGRQFPTQLEGRAVSDFRCRGLPQVLDARRLHPQRLCGLHLWSETVFWSLTMPLGALRCS